MLERAVSAAFASAIVCAGKSWVIQLPSALVIRTSTPRTAVVSATAYPDIFFSFLQDINIL